MIIKNFTTLGNEISFDGKNLTYKAYPAYYQKYPHIKNYPILYDKDKVISTYNTEEYKYKIPEDIVENYCIHCAVIQRYNKHNFPDDPTVYDILHYTLYYRGYYIDYDTNEPTCYFSDDNGMIQNIIVRNNPKLTSDFLEGSVKVEWLSPYYFKAKTNNYIVFGWFKHR